MANLRVVKPGEKEEAIGVNRAAAHELLDRVLDANPMVLAFLYETEDDYEWKTIPQSDALARGLMEDCMEVMSMSRHDNE